MLSFDSRFINNVYRTAMAPKPRSRLPPVQPLSTILPKGAEGGKEFARIIDLLLYHEARRSGKNLTLFNDSAGDYLGMDSFEGDSYRRSGTTAYQYKFYSSPLSEPQRKNIEMSLRRTNDNQEKLKLKKWILVLPDDLTESGTRKTGGDLSWFENLRKKHDLRCETELWGHKKLISLFLETPSLCLRYYPELLEEGSSRRKTLEDTRKRYDDNLQQLYGRIEFIGMSVYKEEATSGVPMERIYIPLSASPETSDDLNENGGSINPLEFLRPGLMSVILGDPGSGKSTLLRFLALVGISPSLQKRYTAKTDGRLPILIILRRYADELKSRSNLSLLDHIIEVVQADFCLKAADMEFFEYALENGDAILLFDGLDELPSPQFKKTVRDRILGLITTYPGNTVIVSSRIVGYGNPFRFDDKSFRHAKLARLQLPEIEQFIKDWYSVRIGNKRERKVNIDDLARIIRDPSQRAIRELAENPLLLTIIALVHRIDAVLPDERVVLYQKCTETLMNTWHKWKFRHEEQGQTGKVERRNRRRIEAIAHWMHCSAGDLKKHEKSIIPYEKLQSFLTEHIANKERMKDTEEALDSATEFLDFISKRAGLLIEVGDHQYSFVHLTFQEYLTATHMITEGETQGVSTIWKHIVCHCGDLRWREVIRLLIAGLKSPESQKVLLQHLFDECDAEPFCALHLGGLLLDGIEPAEDRQEDILVRLFRLGASTQDADHLRQIVSMLRGWFEKNGVDPNKFWRVYEAVEKQIQKKTEKLALTLLTLLVVKDFKIRPAFLVKSLARQKRIRTLFKIFFNVGSRKNFSSVLKEEIEGLQSIDDYLSFEGPGGSIIAAVGQAVTIGYMKEESPIRLFEREMGMLVYLDGTFCNHNFYNFVIAGHPSLKICPESQPFANLVIDPHQSPPGPKTLVKALALARGRDFAQPPDQDETPEWDTGWVEKPARDRALSRARALARARGGDWAETLDRVRTLNRDLDRALAHAQILDRVFVWNPDLGEALDPDPDLDVDVIRALHAQSLNRALARARARARTSDLALDLNRRLKLLWKGIPKDVKYSGAIIDHYCDVFKLKPKIHWQEALRIGFLPKVSVILAQFYSRDYWAKVEKAFTDKRIRKAQIYAAAWLLLIDTWLWIYKCIDEPHNSPFIRLAELTRDAGEAPLIIAHCIRDLAYGNKKRIDDLVAMVNSDDPAYRDIFRRCYWID